MPAARGRCYCRRPAARLKIPQKTNFRNSLKYPLTLLKRGYIVPSYGNAAVARPFLRTLKRE